MFNITVISKNVNSRPLFNKFNDTLIEAIQTTGVKWTNDTSRDSFVGLIEDYLNDMINDNKLITQCKAVSDKRNNPHGFTEAQEWILDVYYKQQHCLNMTWVSYHVRNPKAPKTNP